MENNDYQEIAWAELKVDIYGGEKCEEHIKQWSCYFDGDMEGDVFTTPLELHCKNFPPGTKVTIEVPVCPDCDMISELCDCGFDWHNWTEERYS